MPEDTVAVGVELIEHLEHDQLRLPDLIDRLEMLTVDPAKIREILDTAEKRGLISRDDGVVAVNSTGLVSFEKEVIEKEGDFRCRRCNASISTGYFMNFGAGEHGPFGSTCILYVLGKKTE